MSQSQWIWIVGMVVIVAVFWYLRRPSVTSADAHRLVSEGAPLIDVRTRAEFANGHLPGAKNIPVDELTARAAEVGPRDRPVIVYCASGMRSANAVRILKSAGYADVRNLGAMGNW
jgi:phage shock protein E